MKLSTDDNELLQELLDNDEGVKVLYKALEQMLQQFEEDLINHPYTPGNELALAYKKARLDGARKFLTEIKVVLKLKS